MKLVQNKSEIICYEPCVLKNMHVIGKEVCIIPEANSDYLKLCPCMSCLVKGTCKSFCNAHFDFIKKGNKFDLKIKISDNLVDNYFIKHGIWSK
ncbi:MAG: hypothetical protein B6I17_03875 [Tenericutes bacterium 4572_104]|nr:MAG: hypothetical protein B6I17_03875 [Tenericutes bacterium 4572_104]